MHKVESRETGNTFPKQYWLAVHGKPKKAGTRRLSVLKKPAGFKTKQKAVNQNP